MLEPGRRRRVDRGRRRRRGDDRPLGLRQLPRRARHARPAGRLRRQPGRASTRCWRCSAPPTPSCSSTRSTRSPPRTRRRSCSGSRRWPARAATPSQFARDLLAHLRHLLVTQTTGEVPDHLRRHRHRHRAARQPRRGAIGAADPGPHDRRAGDRPDRGPRGRRRAHGGRDRPAESGATRPGSVHARACCGGSRGSRTADGGASGRGSCRRRGPPPPPVAKASSAAGPPTRATRGRDRSGGRAARPKHQKLQPKSPSPRTGEQQPEPAPNLRRPPKLRAARSVRSFRDAETEPSDEAGQLRPRSGRRIWPAVLDKLRETSPALAATFEGARPVVSTTRRA